MRDDFHLTPLGKGILAAVAGLVSFACMGVVIALAVRWGYERPAMNSWTLIPLLIALGVLWVVGKVTTAEGRSDYSAHNEPNVARSKRRA